MDVPEQLRVRPLGAWVAVEMVQVRHSGSLILPEQAAAPQVFAARVLAIGSDVGLLACGVRVELPFEVGDFVLCTYQCGHPHMSGERPETVEGRPGRTVPVELDCGLFGGSDSKQVGLVPFMPQGLPPIHTDDEAAQRVARVKEITDLETRRRNHVDAKPDPRRIIELHMHKRRLKQIETAREGKRRTRFVVPLWDDALGEGIIAVVEDLGTLLGFGLDPEDLWETLHPGEEFPDETAGQQARMRVR